MKELVLEIDVILDETYRITGNKRNVMMIMFHGECKSKLFQGTILNGGVDTQIQEKGSLKTLSARYILEGKDFEGKNCHLFIENNGIVDAAGNVSTRPVICTDSPVLQWLETEALIGTVEGKNESEVMIRIYKETEDGCRA